MSDKLSLEEIFNRIYLTFKNDIKELLRPKDISSDILENPLPISMYEYPDYEDFLNVYKKFSIFKNTNDIKDFSICEGNMQSNNIMNDILRGYNKYMTERQIIDNVLNRWYEDKMHSLKSNNNLSYTEYLEKLKSLLRENCFRKLCTNGVNSINDYNTDIIPYIEFTPFYDKLSDINQFILKPKYLGEESLKYKPEILQKWDNELEIIKKKKSIYLSDVVVNTEKIVYNCGWSPQSVSSPHTVWWYEPEYDFIIELLNELYSVIILYNINNPQKAKAYIKSANKLFRRLYFLKRQLKNKMDCNNFFFKKYFPGKYFLKGGKPKVKKATKPKVKKESKPKVKKPTKPKVKKETIAKVKKETKPKVKKPTKPKVKKETKPKVKKETKPRVKKVTKSSVKKVTKSRIKK